MSRGFSINQIGLLNDFVSEQFADVIWSFEIDFPSKMFRKCISHLYKAKEAWNVLGSNSTSTSTSLLGVKWVDITDPNNDILVI